MTQILTARELLAQEPQTSSDLENTFRLDTDLLLDDSAFNPIRKMLQEDRSINGLEVVGKDGESLGIISRKTFFLYIRELELLKNRQKQTMGGNIGQLEGKPPSSMMAIFVCKCSDPPVTKSISRPKPINCPQCGQQMTFSQG